MKGPSDPVVIGTITAPHGVRGTLKVKTPGSGRHLKAGVEPFVGGKRRRILKSNATLKGFLVDLEGITSRADAEKLRGVELTLNRTELEETGEDEFYAGDLIGLEAFDGSGDLLGTVAETFETPAHEILVLVCDGEVGAELYIPFTLEHVPEVSIEGGFLVVNPPEEE